MQSRAQLKEGEVRFELDLRIQEILDFQKFVILSLLHAHFNMRTQDCVSRFANSECVASYS